MKRDWNRLKRWIIKRRLQDWSVTEICAHAQISRDAFYRWWNKYQTEGLDSLKERPRGRPRGTRVSSELRRKIVRLRKRYEWGLKR